MPLKHSTVELSALKLVGEDGIEPSPLDFQSIVHTEYTILPLKLVAVLRVSTPLSPQRAMHQLIMSGNPFYARARINYLSIKPFRKCPSEVDSNHQIWSLNQESNPKPIPYEGIALPIVLLRHGAANGA